MKSAPIIAVLAVINLTACVEASGVRVSRNEMMIESKADPECGGIGAMRAAQQQAAIETIRAGYDRFLIEDGASANNVYYEEQPGYYETTREKDSSGHRYTKLDYTPPSVSVRGSHNQSLTVKMFRYGEPGGSNAISAKEILGPDWPRLVQRGIDRC